MQIVIRSTLYVLGYSEILRLCNYSVHGKIHSSFFDFLGKVFLVVGPVNKCRQPIKAMGK